MSMNVSEYTWHRLQEWGLHRIYGYPGDGVGGLDVALEKAEGLQYVQVRHEEMAAFMATGHAKFTGEVGLCCMPLPARGAIHLLDGALTTRRWTTSRWLPSSGSRRAVRSAPTTSRRSISSPCSRTWRAISLPLRLCRARFAI